MAINLTTLKYIVALDNHRNFVKAAESCRVSQPSLSTAIKNLEAELDMVLFDRGTQPVSPTPMGSKVVAMARKTLSSALQIEEFAAAARGDETGSLALCVHPTVAPYILADFFKTLRTRHPGIRLTVEELRTAPATEKLMNAELDAVIMPSPQVKDRMLEIPLYRESYLAYVSPTDPLYQQKEIELEDLATTRIWLMEEGFCLQTKVESLCHVNTEASVAYHAGSVATLLDIVDKNGGYTIIPRLHADLLSSERRLHLRTIVSRFGDQDKHIPARTISLIIRDDFVRERMLNIVAEAVKGVIPEEMIDKRLKNFKIVL